jgi:hypothetical protein
LNDKNINLRTHIDDARQDVSAKKVQGSAGGGLFVNHQPVTNKITIVPPLAGMYNESDTLTFVMTHPFAMNATGTPQIEIDMGGSYCSR